MDDGRPERIDLAEADDLRDVAHRAVACLAQGGAVALPIEGRRGVLASPLPDQAIGRGLAAGDGRGARPVVLLRGAEEASDWSAGLGEAGARLARRGWPGPLTLVADAGEAGLSSRLSEVARRAILADGLVAMNVPADGLLREIIRLVPGPVVAFEIADSARLEGLTLVVDAGADATGPTPTVVRVGAEGWRVERAGAISEADLGALAGAVWLFVCTGNTCRSPMAEALCKALLAARVGCKVEQLVARGFVVRSAGVGASEGAPAASHAVEVVAGRGGSLRSHASRRATAEVLRGADLIVGLAGEHLDIVLEIAPDVADRVRLLRADGEDVLDPIGSDRANYQQTAREIEACLAKLIAEVGP